MYNDPDKLANYIASFANSEGGLIILGVSEEKIEDEKGKSTKIYPKEITWGEISLAKETLENKIRVRIKPQIDGLFIRPIRKKEKVIFLIDIPKSNSSPHMSPDCKYNKRLNFMIQAMDHYEVVNLFRVNSIMKEKLVEKIYEPLASILEKHTGLLSEYSTPSISEIDEILSRTYYKMQMPLELQERLDFYADQIKALDRKEYSARRAMKGIINRNVGEYLRWEILPSENGLKLELKATGRRKSQIELYPQLLYQLLLKNQKVRDYSNHWSDDSDYEKIDLTYSDATRTENLDKFDEIIWSKCLKEASENAEVLQLKETAEALLEEAWNLIEQIARY